MRFFGYAICFRHKCVLIYRTYPAFMIYVIVNFENPITYKNYIAEVNTLNNHVN